MLTKRTTLFCKVVEVLQDFLSENVDKKFTTDYNVALVAQCSGTHGTDESLNRGVADLQLASRLNLKYLRRFIFLPFLPHFCFALGRSWEITLNVVWVEKEFDAYKLSRSMYQSMFNSFPVI